MKHWFLRLSFILLCWLAFPQRCPAPLIYTPGEGWHYEQAGSDGGSWMRQTAKEQLDVAQNAFEHQDYSTAMKAANRIVSHEKWRFGDYAPRAQYLLGRCHEAKGQDEKAFSVYEQLLKEYPKVENYDEIVTREFMIANRYLAGKLFYKWGFIPYRSMDGTIALYEQVIRNGPYSDVAPQAQMSIGLAHLSKKGLFMNMPDYPEAAKAFDRAAQRYADKKVGADALFEEAMAYTRQASRAEYDQSIAARAISTFTEFIASHPEDSRINQAQKMIDSLKTEQARGSFDIARFYEQKHKWRGALIYYNEVLLKDPGSSYAKLALLRIDDIIKNHGAQQ
jgi:outer membrane assembly lipoprotein YfiO